MCTAFNDGYIASVFVSTFNTMFFKISRFAGNKVSRNVHQFGIVYTGKA